MTDALDRAACSAWEAMGYEKFSDADWPDLPSYVREHWRGVAVAALTVMADDIRARYLTIIRDEFGRGISAARLERILDAYIPYTGSSDD